MKHKILSFFLLLTLLFAVSFPTVLAYMVKQTEKIENVIKPAKVSCEVVEAFNGTSKTSVKVKNTSNIEAYIRVRVVSYWQDSKGSTVAIGSEMPSFMVSNDWIEDDDNDTYYCKVPVQADALTPELLQAGSTITLSKKVETYKDVMYEYYQVVEIFAEAIQSLPEETVETCWDVTITDGQITAVN